MAGTIGFFYNPLPALSPVAATSSSVKLISTHLLAVRLINKPIGLVGYAHHVRSLAMVARYGGGSRREFDFDDEMFFEEEEEEGVAKRVYDPNLDIDRIGSSTVRLLDEQNSMLGVMPLGEAIRRADNTDLVLAIVSAEADPPVLRLFEEQDYKKHKFEKQKKKKIQQRKSAARMKELKMGYSIDDHDYSVKQRQATKFLKEGHKVKIIVNLKGRQNQYKDQAIGLLRRFQNEIGQLASEESKNFVEKNIYIVLMPNKATIQREQQLRQREEQLKKEQEEACVEEQLKGESEGSTSAEEISANV